MVSCLSGNGVEEAKGSLEIDMEKAYPMCRGFEDYMI